VPATIITISKEARPMTDEERGQEGVEEEIEDLEAPAEAQIDVVGGQDMTTPVAANAPAHVITIPSINAVRGIARCQ
jgi:hypothetical protein